MNSNYKFLIGFSVILGLLGVALLVNDLIIGKWDFMGVPIDVFFIGINGINAIMGISLWKKKKKEMQ